MSSIDQLGVLTLATSNDFLKAIGLALSVRVSNPGLPIAVACSPTVKNLVQRYFDYVVEEEAGLRGFVHKVHLDTYSPFDQTMFFDSDVLVFKSILPYINKWGDGPYYARGEFLSDGFSAFGMDRAAVLKKIGKATMTVIDGAGHAFFRRPECSLVFDKARAITAKHEYFVGKIPYADEDVIDIALTMLDIAPAPMDDFFARYFSAKPGTMKMDAASGYCSFIDKIGGSNVNPCMVHFAANEAPIRYYQQLVGLYKKFDVPTTGLFKQAVHDFYELEMKLPLSHYRREVKKRLLRLTSS